MHVLQEICQISLAQEPRGRPDCWKSQLAAAADAEDYCRCISSGFDTSVDLTYKQLASSCPTNIPDELFQPKWLAKIGCVSSKARCKQISRDAEATEENHRERERERERESVCVCVECRSSSAPAYSLTCSCKYNDQRATPGSPRQQQSFFVASIASTNNGSEKE